jgi:hypothetical protein
MSRKKKHNSHRTRRPSDQSIKKSFGGEVVKLQGDSGFVALFIFISLLIVTFHKTLEFSPFFSRWIIILLLACAFLYQVLPPNLRFKLPPKMQQFLTPRNLNLVLIVSISIQVFNGSKLTAIQTVTPIWFGVFLLISLFLLLQQVLKRNSDTRSLKLNFKAPELQPFLVALLLVSTLMTTRNIKMISIDITNDSFSKAIVYSVIFVFTAFFLLNWKILEKTSNKSSRIFMWFFLTLLNLWLAFRNDTLKSIEGSYFHVGYYAEVVKSLHSGGTLLYDTPSQYGFLNLLLLSWIPVEDSRLAVYMGQAILMFLLVSFVLLVLQLKLKSNKTFLGFSLITITVFYFADPELIGPQVYPSSSALRFAPSLAFLLVMFLYSQKAKFTNSSFNLITGIGLFVGALWSAESLIYCASIFGMVHISRILLAQEQRVRNLVFASGTFVAAIALSLLAFNVYTLSASNHSADLSMHFMYALGYSSGFGSIPLQFATPGWIVVFLISYSSVRARECLLKKDLEGLTFFAGIVGALLGWFTYFLGRAYPENIIAQFPLIVIVILLLIIHENALSTRLGAEDQPQYEEDRNFWIPTVVLISVLIISIVGQPKFISTFLKTTSFTSPNIQSSIKLNASAVALLDAAALPLTPLPMVYEGYAGVLPEIGSNKSAKIDATKTWLPVPLGLLEEPISQEMRAKTLSRFISKRAQSGYLLYAVKDSFNDRHLQLMAILTDTHKCTSLGINSDFELILCEKL